MIVRTERDVLRAYRVYLAKDIIQSRVRSEDADIYVTICAITALYNGITLSELQKVLPISKNVLKELVRRAVYTYGILDFNGSVVIGHRPFLDGGSKGVLSIPATLQEEINNKRKTIKIGRKKLIAFASVLSNVSAHTIIMKENIENIDSKGVLKHMFLLWFALLSGDLYSGSTFAKNLARLGYMRPSGFGVELNKDAVFMRKEPEFELR